MAAPAPLLIPPGMGFWKALQAGLVEPLRSEQYIAWLKTCPCCICGVRPRDGVDPHHVIGGGLKGGGTKTPDIMAIPLCRRCHEELHRGHVTWEKNHGLQLEFVARILVQAIYEGKLVLVA